MNEQPNKLDISLPPPLPNNFKKESQDAESKGNKVGSVQVVVLHETPTNSVQEKSSDGKVDSTITGFGLDSESRIVNLLKGHRIGRLLLAMPKPVINITILVVYILIQVGFSEDREDLYAGFYVGGIGLFLLLWAFNWLPCITPMRYTKKQKILIIGMVYFLGGASWLGCGLFLLPFSILWSLTLVLQNTMKNHQ